MLNLSRAKARACAIVCFAVLGALVFAPCAFAQDGGQDEEAGVAVAGVPADTVGDVDTDGEEGADVDADGEAGNGTDGSADADGETGDGDGTDAATNVDGEADEDKNADADGEAGSDANANEDKDADADKDTADDEESVDGGVDADGSSSDASADGEDGAPKADSSKTDNSKGDVAQKDAASTSTSATTTAASKSTTAATPTKTATTTTTATKATTTTTTKAADPYASLSAAAAKKAKAAGAVQVTNINTSWWWRLAASTNAKACLDVVNGSASQKAGVQIYSRNYTMAQMWRFESAGGGWYYLRCSNSDLCLDVRNGNVKSPGSVWMFRLNKTAAQQWSLWKNADGTYTLVNRKSGLVLDIAGGKTKNGTAVRQYAANWQAGQRFRLQHQVNLLAEGVYSIWSVGAGRYADVAGASTDEGTNLQVWSGNGTLAQKFCVELVGSNVYRIQSLLTGRFVVNDYGNATIRDWPDGGGPRWVPVVKAGRIIFHSNGGSKVLDVAGGAAYDGANLQLYKVNGTAAQLFELRSTPAFVGGTYLARTGLDWGRVIDIDASAWLDSSWDSGAAAQLWNWIGAGNQRLGFTGVGNGYYEIYVSRSGLALDVENGDPHGRVRQWEANHTAAQRWTVSWNKANRAYEICSAINPGGLALDVSNADSHDGAWVQCWDRNRTRAQAWFLNPTDWLSEDRPVHMSGEQQAMLDEANRHGSSTGWLVLVNLSTCHVGVFTGGQGSWGYVNYMLCSPGADSSPTVTGEYTINYHLNSFGSGYTCWYASQFYGGYMFHSVLYEPGSMSDIQDGRLGMHLSHGCVRLALEDARWIYYEVPVGTTVYSYW